MSSAMSAPAAAVHPLLRVRQFREFTAEPVEDAALEALADVARWSGSSQNEQPWRFIVVRSSATVRRLGEIGAPYTRALGTAPAAIAIVLPEERAVSRAFDEGRAAERILIGASLQGLGGGIAWFQPEARDAVREVLGLPSDRFVRTIVALGHPTEAALRPKSEPGKARLPRAETVFEERWPQH